MVTDTIFALSSGSPPAAIAIVRISGPEAGAALDRLAGTRPAPRRATMRVLRARDGITIDRALTLWLPGPRTATGEDTVELHLHGGRAVVAAALAALDEVPGLRRAEAGEFTRQALINGRIDLTQAEGLADLLAAETEQQRRAALRSAEGGVGREIDGWLARLTDLAAMVEAVLDYGEEAEEQQQVDLTNPLATLANEIEEALARPPVERLRDGVRVTLAGAPNAGKSSLFNALCEREAAITSPIAGTTRDVVEMTVVRGGLIYVLADTAGLAETTDDPIEAIGIARARERIERSDLVLWLDDTPPPLNALWLYPRADARSDNATGRMATSVFLPGTIDQLWRQIETASLSIWAKGDGQHYNKRQRAQLRDTYDAIERGLGKRDLLLLAEDLREARSALRRLMGYDDIEPVLDALFARFCLGK